jgi:predicted transcriptional regulator
VRSGYPAAVRDRPIHVLVAENLTRITEDEGITLVDVAERAGIDPRELYAVLTGSYDADLDWLHNLAEALQVSMAALVIDLEDDRGPRVVN